ncbi:MAG: UvrD-helicase domain-containing protein [Clostridia bacterium]|nr:UvrD-helicase domain-containing protein [Clostridia bacterium]
MDYSSLLNEEQLKAVLNTEGPVLVSAGAGSGKTRVLTYRIAYLLTELHVDPYRILAITFTNKATNEMKERVCKIREDASLVMVATFHSFCVRMLRKYQSVLEDYQPNFSIYTDSDQTKVYKQVFADLGITDDETKSRIKHAISVIKNDNIHIDEYCEINKHTKGIDMVRRGYFAYQNELIKNNAMDFDDLLINFYRLIVKNEDVRNSLQDRFQYIHIDEFQDTNKLQYEIVKILGAKHQNVFIVGDEDQSIYSWRGANVGNIFQFSKDFKNVKIFKLEQNYRSTKAILDKANMLIENNKNRLSKKLYTTNAQGSDVTYFCARDEQDEADYVVRHIIQQRALGVDLNNIAILLRLNALTRPFEEKLLAYNIPHKIYNGVKFYERAEIKSTLSYLIAIVNPNDSTSFTRLINFPKRGIGDTSISRLKELADVRKCSIKEIIYNSDTEDIKPALRSKLQPLKQLLQSIDQKAQEVGLYELISFIVDEAKILQSFNQKDETELDRYINVTSLMKSIKDYEEANPNATLSEYLESVTLISDIDTESSKNGVIIATVHAAKGLEFDTVFISGLEEKIFPVSRAELDEQEEERRLMYVAITRARKDLYLTSSSSRFMYGKRDMSVKSRFLREIDVVKDQAFGYGGYYGDTSNYPRYKKEYGSNNSDYGDYSNNKYIVKSNPQYKGYTNNTYGTTNSSSYKTNTYGGGTSVGGLNIAGLSKGISKQSIDTSKVKVGAKVSHVKFGNGVIVDTSSYASNRCVTIDFGVIGKKALSLDYAPITFIND